MALDPTPNGRCDLKARTRKFAQDVRSFIEKIPKKITNMDDIKQVLRSSGSIGANYREADEASSKRDFAHKIKICRRESKESGYWLELLGTDSVPTLNAERMRLIQEAYEFVLMFSAMVRKMGHEHDLKNQH